MRKKTNKSYKKKIGIIVLLSLLIVALSSIIAYAAPSQVEIPNVDISVGNGDGTAESYVSNIKLFILLTILSLLPSLIIMVTSFTRIIVVFSFLKNALGATQSIPSKVLVGLALFLTFFIMRPVYNDMNTNGIQPYEAGTITQDEAIYQIGKPLKEFMLKQTREKDLKLFIDSSNMTDEEKDNLTKDNVSFTVLIPAFAISELKTAFQIGFLIYLPFILIDLVVGSVLMSMGMFMLPPATVSLPFKLLLFVMVDGWNLLVKSLILSFG